MDQILVEPFYRNGRLVGALIKNLLNDFACCTIYDYFVENNKLLLEVFDNGKVPDNLKLNGGETSSIYSHKLFVSLQNNLIPVVENIVGAEVLPTYNYARKYTKGVELLCHRDRPHCEITVSLSVLYSGAEKEYLYISPHPKDKSSDDDIIGFDLAPGQAVLFFGTADENTNNTEGFYHWRDPVKNDFIFQSFLHYVYKDGCHKDLAFEYLERGAND